MTVSGNSCQTGDSPVKREASEAALTRADIGIATVIPRLPSRFGRGGEIPDDLIGAEIVAFGTLPFECDLSGGGLVIDYLEPRERKLRRLVLEASDTGMWAAHKGSPLEAPNRNSVSE